MNYYLGPYDIRVPAHIKNIVAKDGVNHGRYITLPDGNRTFMETQVYVSNPLTEDQYKIKHCTKHADGTWWYNSA